MNCQQAGLSISLARLSQICRGLVCTTVVRDGISPSFPRWSHKHRLRHSTLRSPWRVRPAFKCSTENSNRSRFYSDTSRWRQRSGILDCKRARSSSGDATAGILVLWHVSGWGVSQPNAVQPVFPNLSRLLDEQSPRTRSASGPMLRTVMSGQGCCRPLRGAD